jgi:hypothetical protein
MSEQEKIKELETRLALYEKDGAAKLFYALNRKMNEMADMLNKQSLTTLDLTDAKDKSFERLKVVWNDAAGIATAVRALGETAGVTNDETKDTQNPKFRVVTTSESIANVLGNTAGQNH